MKKKLQRRLNKWIADLWRLQDDITRWAREDGWEPKIFSKKLRDTKFDDLYRVPCLVLKKGGVGVILDPYGRHISGIDGGACDFYRMPELDNKWKLLYDKGRWQFEGGDVNDRVSLDFNEPNFNHVMSQLCVAWTDQPDPGHEQMVQADQDRLTKP